jgi:hypothetical protein
MNIIMSGRAKIGEVVQYFAKYANSTHKLDGWAEIKK